MALGFITPRRSNNIARDKLSAASPRKFAPHTHANEVAILAIIRYPFLDLLFIGAFDGPAVNLKRLPAMLESAKTLPEASSISRRIAKGQPDDFGLFIGHGSFGHFPNAVRNSRGFIKNQNNAFALVVQPLESIYVMLTPGDKINPPGKFMFGVVAADTRRAHIEPIRRIAQPEPLTYLRNGLGAELRACAGGSKYLAIRAGVHRPLHDHAHEGRLADAVPAGYRYLAGNVPSSWIRETIPQIAQQLALPFPRPQRVVKRWFPPRVEALRVSERIVNRLRHFG